MELIIAPDDISVAGLARRPEAAAAPGQVIMRVERAAFTANVLSYAVTGHSLGYFRFFPAAKEGMVTVPSWGIARVLVSRHPDVREGERFYGIFPYAELATLTVSRARPDGFVDLAPHRKDLAVIYNTYSRLDPDLDKLYVPGTEDLMVLFRPLFITSWLLKQFVQDHAGQHAGPLRVVLVSASSKTAYALAYLLQQRASSASSISVVGLTSARNVDFVQSLALYDQVVVYDDIEAELAPNAAAGDKTMVIDMAGSAKVLERMSKAVPDAEVVRVGATHWEEDSKGLPGTFFFAPQYAETTVKRLGYEGFSQAVGRDWEAFLKSVGDNGWCQVEHRTGPEAVLATYETSLQASGMDPSQGLVLSMAPIDTKSSL